LATQNSDEARKVILVHGMWMSGLSLRFIGNRLSKKGWQVVYYSYPSMFGAFGKSVDELYALWQIHNSSRTHLVGHSLGGLLILAMMQKYQLKELPRSLFMGCPVKGSAVAKKMEASRMGRTLLGKSINQLVGGKENVHGNKIGVIAG